MAKATFAAGCFWGVELLFQQTQGVTSTRVGYTGGHTENPTYPLVCNGNTGHAEALEVEFDPKKISYESLLNIFWENHDPTTLNRQGPDEGTQYRSAIFFHTPEQQIAAMDSKEKLSNSKKFRSPIVTEIIPATTFYPAEEYHQRYLQKQGIKHCSLKNNDDM
jgi:peptide-methionine (S)-S-oxide reductase